MKTSAGTGRGFCSRPAPRTLTATLPLSASRFQTRADNLARDADDRFIFRTTDKTLWFDSNGNGAGGLTMLADLDAAATMTSADIFLM